MLRKIRAVLFDLDGVLVDSVEAWLIAFNETLGEFGKRTLTKEEFLERCWGSELEVNMEKLGLGQEGARHCQARYEEHIDEVKIPPNVRKTLGSLREKVGLVTSTPRMSVHQILSRFNLRKHFDAVITGDEVDKPKPDPAPVLKACKQLNVSPKEAVFVGDTKADIQAGRSAGCTVVGLNVKGDFKVNRISELHELLEKGFD